MAGLGAWGLKIFYAAASDRNTFKMANLAVFATGAMNCLWIVYDLQGRNGLSEVRQFIAWASLSECNDSKTALFTRNLLEFNLFISFHLPFMQLLHLYCRR